VAVLVPTLGVGQLVSFLWSQNRPGVTDGPGFGLAVGAVVLVDTEALLVGLRRQAEGLLGGEGMPDCWTATAGRRARSRATVRTQVRA